MLDGVHRAHLVGDGANAANARDDVGDFLIAAAADESLEEARRLEDAKLRRGYAPVRDLQVERTFAFDAGEVIDEDGFSRHVRRFLCGTAPRRH